MVWGGVYRKVAYVFFFLFVVVAFVKAGQIKDTVSSTMRDLLFLELNGMRRSCVFLLFFFYFFFSR